MSSSLPLSYGGCDELELRKDRKPDLQNKDPTSPIRSSDLRTEAPHDTQRRPDLRIARRPPQYKPENQPHNPPLRLPTKNPNEPEPAQPTG
ncbi:hypothetical protein Ssi02_74170 [Sinosporangium siamense]|uniref:Uncharacterized protein n=1 Tax=Sinosporangium siamense TaxID=1367973 RepID=A0A919VB49_9ACTN|nr:hypothetical protein Ssi02_74170 [Sinosporangium siamense]